MSKHTPAGRTLPIPGRAASGLVLALTVLAASLALAPAAFATYPPNYNPLLVISEENWRDCYSMTQSDIQAFLETQKGVLKSYSCAEGGPSGTHSQVIKPASQIIAEAAVYYRVNPKLIIATLEKEQSLISQPWHTGRDIDPTSTHNYSTEYHLMYAMGAGVYPGSPDRHPGFGDQVWEGARLLGKTDGPYAWHPGKVKRVYSYEHSANIDIVPLNQPTWNFYTYTPYYPQFSVWAQYNKFFGDPLVNPDMGRVHRFYNKKNGSHFYTASENERYLVSLKFPDTFAYEGTAYSIATSSTVNADPLYRFYNKRNGSHFYTSSAAEKDQVIATFSATYSFEGPAYNVSSAQQPGSVPVYRFYNKRNGSHFYTISAAEKDQVIAKFSSTYAFEGVAYHVELKR